MDLTPELSTEQLFLIVAAGRQRKAIMIDMMARFLITGPLLVIDGGNDFDAFALARSIRRRTPELGSALNRAQTTRAFTCYQLLAILRQTPADRRPKAVLNLLAPFQDESVELIDRDFLLRESLDILRRLSRSAPVIISARPPAHSQAELTSLYEMVEEAAGNIMILRDAVQPSPRIPQLSFF